MLPSLIPATNAWLFNVLQVLPLLFLCGDYVYRSAKLDTIDALDARTQSNADYIGGMALGMILVYLIFGAFSLFSGMLLNLFASKLAFNATYYLFYLICYILPTTVFLTGLSFFIVNATRNRSFSLIILLGYLCITYVLLTDTLQGILDPFARHIPNTFSEIAGFPDPWGYLFHRLCWFFLGISLLSAGVALARRLPNRTDEKRYWLIVGGICLMLGMGCGSAFVLKHQDTVQARKHYSDVYRRHNALPKVTLTHLDIDYLPMGKRLKATSRLQVHNRNSKAVEKLLFYLNPSLKPETVRVNGEEYPWQQEAQVILIPYRLAIEQACEVEIIYSGKIDERICYPDIPDKIFFDHSERGIHKCRFGKRFAYLNKDYTLLTPECLWYPVAIPPANPECVYAVDKHFFSSHLKVRNVGERSVFSQGSFLQNKDTVSFHSTKPLTGLSLVMGKYTGGGLSVNSVEYAHYTYPGHGDYFNGLQAIRDTLPNAITYFNYGWRGKAYPFDRLTFLETPLAFCSFYRNSRQGSGYVQPELYLFPEQMIGILLPDFDKEVKCRRENDRSANRKIATPYEYEMIILSSFLMEYFGDFLFETVRPDDLLRLWNKKEKWEFTSNPYSNFPLYHGYTTHFHSETYPFFNLLISLIIYRAELEEYVKNSMPGSYLGTNDHTHIREYLTKNSLADALSDTSLSSIELNDLLKIKAEHLMDILLCHFSSEQLNRFLLDFVQKHTFKQIDFNTLNNAYKQQLGIDWNTFFPQWYSQNRLPAYIIRDFKAEKITEPGNSEHLHTRERHKVQLCIYNIGEVDGIISFVFANDKGPQRKNFIVEKKKGQRIEWIGENIVYLMTLLTNISENKPVTRSHILKKELTTQDTVLKNEELPFSYFQTPPNEIIVNEDEEGFRIIEPFSRKLLSHLWKDKDKKYMNYEYSGYPSQWKYLAAPSYAYGDITEGYVSKKAGKGNFSVEWHTQTEKTGRYEVFVYMTPIPSNSCKRIQQNRSLLLPYDELQLYQYYQVTHDGGLKEVPLNVNYRWEGEKGTWLSLGQYILSPGEQIVSLSDKTDIPDFNIYADAVKWVYLGEK